MIFRFHPKNKKIDKVAADSFWQWFEANETQIKRRCVSDVRNLEHEIGQRLRAVFPYFDGIFEIHIGLGEGRGEFFFFHGGDRHLAGDAESLGELMPNSLRGRWKFIFGR